jgi:hypothetical protein
MQRGVCADQQLKVWHDADKDTKAVLDFIVQETEKI